MWIDRADRLSASGAVVRRRATSWRALRSGALAVLVCVPGCGVAVAQVDDGETPPLSGTAVSSDQPGAQSPSSSIEQVIGDPGGLRAALSGQGIAYSFTYIGEVMANLSGGSRRGAIGQGRLDAQLDLDLSRIVGWSGAALHANAYGIHGHGLSRHYVANLLATSGVEALSSGRLYELWLEQKLLDDKVSLRAGQLALDTEFIVSQFAGVFVSSTFGFPGIGAANLPNGGPAYPLATPGVRVKFAPSEALSFAGAVFNGNPAGTGPGDPQRDNRSGVEFRARDPALLIGEVAYAYNKSDPKGRTGILKVGAWHHLGPFADQRLGIAPDGALAPLADPAASAVPRRLRGNTGGYLVVDQVVYRVPGTSDGGLGIFARLAGSPADRNLVDLYADGGLSYKGVIPGRPDDTLGLGVAYARFSSRVRGFDADAGAVNPGTFQPIRSSELALEATYQAQLGPGVTVQPDVQYVIRPGGGILDPRGVRTGALKDAVVVGVRSSIRY